MGGAGASDGLRRDLPLRRKHKSYSIILYDKPRRHIDVDADGGRCPLAQVLRNSLSELPPPTGHETLSSAVTGMIFNTNS